MIIHLIIKKQKYKNNRISSRFYKSVIKNYNDMTMKLLLNVSFILSIINAGFITDMNDDIKCNTIINTDSI
jgi:hypothetical protein